MQSTERDVRDETATERVPPTRAERWYGIVGGVALVAALGFGVAWMAGAATDTGAPQVNAPPALVLLSPADDAGVGRPLVVEFATRAALQPDPAGGWGANGMHLHLRAGAAELMPGPGDVRHHVNDRWQWTVRGLEPGTHRIRLFWAGADHRPLDLGASEEIDVTLQ